MEDIFKCMHIKGERVRNINMKNHYKYVYIYEFNYKKNTYLFTCVHV